MKTTILILDTETNGLPANRYAPVSEHSLYPAILQLSWAIYTIDDYQMTPGPVRDIGVSLHPSIPWNVGAAKIHGLSETEARHGTPAAVALAELRQALYSVDVVVAHNLAFDKPVIRAAGYAEASRGDTSLQSLRSLWPPGIKEFCTMRETRDLVKIPATAKQAQYADLGPYKAPRLNELYTWLYGQAYDVSGAVLHNAKSDTHCLAQCIAGLLEKKLLHVAPDGSLVKAITV